MSEFVERLQAHIDEGRSFGRHPLWLEMLEGKLPIEAVRVFAVQTYLQVVEFPRAVSALHARCPDPEQRMHLAESLYEEETGAITGCGMAHPELFIEFGLGVGATRADMEEGVPRPETQALIDWFLGSTQDRPFLEGSASILLASEGQVPGNLEPLARAMEKHYGCSKQHVKFWDLHEVADRDHCDVGGNIVVKMVQTPGEEEAVVSALKESLDHWWKFYDGIAKVV